MSRLSLHAVACAALVASTWLATPVWGGRAAEVLHLVAAPFIAAGLARHYHRDPAGRAPIAVAALFALFVAGLEVALVDARIVPASTLGTPTGLWTTVGLVFVGGWAAGLARRVPAPHVGTDAS